MKIFISIPKAVLIIPIAIFWLAPKNVSAQQVPMGTQYFFNQYLSNPAFAGAKEGFTGNLSYLSQLRKVNGGQTIQTLTADYGFGNRVGIGLNVYNEEFNILGRTRVVGTYAYHLPLNDDDRQLHFGISLGFSNERVDMNNVIGDPGDPEVQRLNDPSTRIDGDLGVAYTSNGFNVQAALPNVRNFLKDETTNTADWATFYTAVSYKIDMNDDDGFALEPKAAYRGSKGNDNILDIGANASLLNEQLQLSALYHTSKSASFGLGVVLPQYNVGALIHYTTNTGGMVNYSNGMINLGLKVMLK